MIQLKTVLTSGLITLLLCLIIVGMALAMSNAQPVQAEAINQPLVMKTTNDIYYLPLTDTPPLRDITQQQFAPLELMP